MIWTFAKIHEIRGVSETHSQSRIHYPTRRPTSFADDKHLKT
jgi:hypothetical protein